MRRMRRNELSYIAGGGVNGAAALKNSRAVSQSQTQSERMTPQLSS